jgi:hypothetical protein
MWDVDAKNKMVQLFEKCSTNQDKTNILALDLYYPHHVVVIYPINH